MSVHVIIGGQYGSEGKGAFTAWLTSPNRVSHPLVIRTGGPNAGHSMKYKGETFKMRHVPCAWHNPTADLALGPGALVDPDWLLGEEIPSLRAADVNIRGRFFIDSMCGIVTPAHREQGHTEQRRGSTGKGVGVATAARVRRTAPIAADQDLLAPYLADVSQLAWEALQADREVIVESAQGFALSLTRSGFYPYVTSRDVTPGIVLNDAGVPLLGRHFNILVLRTYPIRVAGDSGPMRKEIAWDELYRRSGGYIRPETTTVTGKIRRVGEWDPELAAKAVQACTADAVVLTFFDYWRPDLAGKTQLDADAYRRIDEVEKEIGAPVVWVSTGFQSITAIKGLQ